MQLSATKWNSMLQNATLCNKMQLSATK
jgi:hypothetical protein